MTNSPIMTAADITALLIKGFVNWTSAGVTIEDVGMKFARLRMEVGEEALRPGGTISGPVMFTLADTSFYVAVLASIGPQALAVTTNVSINFLKKPEPRALIAECSLLKLGKRLAVGEVSIFSEGHDDMVAHATGTYSIPPR